MEGPAILAPVIAHRGASGDAPENTLAAIALAAEQGASCIEIDVSISRDNVPFVHHDNKLDRCTTGSGLLCELDAGQLDQLSAGKGMADFPDEPLPRLTAVIDLLKQRSMGLNLEIKPVAGLEIATTQAICSTIEQHWPSELPLVFSSFCRLSLQEAMQKLPSVARGLLTGGVPDDVFELLDQYGCRNLHCAATQLTVEASEKLTAGNVGIYCYTVNEIQQAHELFAMGVHGVFTDYPARLLAVPPA